MGFLDSLGDALLTQYGAGENKMRSLDVLREDGSVQKYGKLGEFASKFDTSAERSYTEEGSFRTDLYNPKPKQLEIMMQEPDVTVLIKKRAFGSLADGNRPDLMNADERLLYKATKVLFQNKCKQISDFEKLSKIARVSEEIGNVDYNLLPVIFNVADSLKSGTNGLNGSSSIGGLSGTMGKFQNIVDKVRRAVNFSQDHIYTTWLNDTTVPGKNYLGTGTGVIELTTNVDINTTTSVNWGGGNCGLTISDPYELMRITNNDIENAIADASNFSYNNTFIQFGTSSLLATIEQSKTQLNTVRAGRGANPIKWIVSPETYLGKRLRAIVDNVGEEINFDGNMLKITVDDASRYGGDLGNEGLGGNQELDLFKTIAKSIYNHILVASSS